MGHMGKDLWVELMYFLSRHSRYINNFSFGFDDIIEKNPNSSNLQDGIRENGYPGDAQPVQIHNIIVNIVKDKYPKINFKNYSEKLNWIDQIIMLEREKIMANNLTNIYNRTNLPVHLWIGANHLPIEMNH